MAAKYELFEGKDEQYYFRLRAANGETILSSEGYVNKAGAENGIASVKTNSANDDNYECREAKDESFYFVLKAKNHQIIGKSQMYKSTQARDVGIDSVKNNGPSAPLEDLTEAKLHSYH